ncbi:MAG: phenylalanine--tRNA ligase subunit alpha [Spirochaeta sp.]|jgi:phenylalanyl-tRNA synthetase alpha chain|nr:phenylalanine--tRNA ligase subunit alpha [Spirochaeta sp.]
MVSEATLKSLHPLEVKTLLHFDRATEFDAQKMEHEIGLKLGQCNQALSWLSAKACIDETRRDERVFYERTELGARYAERGTPVERMIHTLAEKGPMTMPELAEHADLEKKDVGSSFGQLSKQGILAMDAEKRVSLVDAGAEDLPAPDAMIRALLERAADGEIAESTLSDDEKSAIAPHAKKRGAASAMFRVVEREIVFYQLNDTGLEVKEALAGKGMTGDEVGRLTPEMLRDGSWRGKTFREYGVDAPTSRLLPGRRNPYCEYLDSVKDKLVSLGFEEFTGPIVETEFWNSDALFMPQFHSARDIHDVYYVKTPSHAKKIEEPYLSRVAKTHEDGWETGSRGWGYGFDRDFTRRLILRSQGTVMSAKSLHTAKVPGKYFGILRCFRYDQVDATHLSDFYQTEGIVLGEEVNLKNLLGLLEMFAVELAGATDVRYVPGYFPFTEPSVEVHIKHPRLGWFELGGSGIFRPEVTKPMGVDVPVLAWGLGIDRMALMHLGLNDLRELFSPDLENVRLRRRSL